MNLFAAQVLVLGYSVGKGRGERGIGGIRIPASL